MVTTLHAKGLCHLCYQHWRGHPVTPRRPRALARTHPCQNCAEVGALLRRGRCPACYVYWWKWRHERPRWYWDRSAVRPPCRNCGLQPQATRRGWCRTCYFYWHHTGRLRPISLAYRLAERRGESVS